MHRTKLIVLAAISSAIGAAFILLTTGFMQIFWGIYFALTLLGLLLKLLTDPRYQNTPYSRAKRYADKRRDCTLFDYIETIETLNEYLNSCDVGDTYSPPLIQELIRRAEYWLNHNRQRGMRYANDRDLDAALETLKLETWKNNLDAPRINAAAQKARTKADLATLKKQKAPKGAIRTAKLRLQEIDKAERLLIHLPKNHAW